MTNLVVAGVATAVVCNRTDSYRLVRTPYYFGQNVALAVKELVLTVAHAEPKRLGSCAWRLLDGVGNIADLPVYAVAVAVSIIPIVNWLPIGGTWATVRRQS